jgi:hypothetical protein
MELACVGIYFLVDSQHLEAIMLMLLAKDIWRSEEWFHTATTNNKIGFFQHLHDAVFSTGSIPVGYTVRRLFRSW